MVGRAPAELASITEIGLALFVARGKRSGQSRPSAVITPAKSPRCLAEEKQVLDFATGPVLLALKEHPDAPVIVDTSPGLTRYGGNGKVLEFLEKNPEVKTAFGAYAVKKNIDYCNGKTKINCRFEVWQRQSTQ
jgi:hypothetical protein